MVTCHRRINGQKDGWLWSLHYFLVLRKESPSRTGISPVSRASLFDQRLYVVHNYLIIYTL